MFRKMRRFKQQLADEEAIKVFERGLTGVLSLIGDEGYPYGVPLNYIYLDGKLYFHGAKSGHKHDAILSNDKASFCVIDKDEIVPQKVTDIYRSVIAFGKIAVVEEDEKKKNIAIELGLKYSPKEAVDEDMRRNYKNMVLYEMVIEHMTGKESMELVNQRK